MVRDVFDRGAKNVYEEEEPKDFRILVTVHGMKVRNATLAPPTSTHTAEHHKHRGEPAS